MSNAPTLVEAGTDKITVRWEKYDEEGDIEFTSYILTLINLFHSSEVMTTVSGNVFSHTFGGINPNAEYRVYIKAVAGPCESGPSPMLAVTTDPVAVTTIEQETQTNDTVTLSWEPSSGDGARSVVSYTLISPVGSTQTTGVNATAEGLQSNTLYNFRIATEYDDGTVVESVDFSGGTVPNPPEDLVLTSTQSRVTADWSPISEGNLHINLYRARSTLDHMVGTSTSNAIFNGILPNRRVGVSVAASNSFGMSEYSETVYTTTLLPDPTIDSTFVTASTVEIHYSLPSHGAAFSFVMWKVKLVARDGSEIETQTQEVSHTFDTLEENTYYAVHVAAVFSNNEETMTTYSREALTLPDYSESPRLDNATTSTLSISWPAYTSGNGEIAYNVFSDNYLVSPDLTDTQYVIEDLDPNTDHSIYIRVKNGAGHSNGLTAIFKTWPGPPQNLEASFDSTGLILEWDAPAGNAFSVSGYRIQYSGETLTGAAAATMATISDLQPATSYSFELFAEFSGAGDTSTTIDVCTAPGLAQNPRITGSTSTSVAVAWDPAPSCATIRFYIVDTASVYGTSTSINKAPNSVVTISIAAVDDGDGETGESIYASGRTLPTAPNFQFTNAHITSIDVTMSYPTKNNGAYTFQHYLVSVNGGPENMETADSFTISGLQGATSYLITVKAVFDGLAQTFDVTETEITDPDQVRNIVLSDITPTSVTVEWDPPIGTEELSHYEVDLDGDVVDSYGLMDRRAEFISLLANSIYNIDIQAKTMYAFSSSFLRFITDPLPITSYTVTKCGSTSVELYWNTPIPQGSYRSTIDTYDVCLPSMACTSSPLSDYTITVASGSVIKVNITATYSLGEFEMAPISVESVLEIAPEPLQVTNVRVMEGTTISDIDVYWDLPANGVGIDSYDITYTYGDNISDVETVIGGDEIFGSVSDLRSNTLYTVSVTAINNCNTTKSEIVEYGTPQDPVYGITPTMTTSNQIEIIFIDPGQDGTYLQLSHYNVFVNGTFESEEPSSTFSLNGLNPATNYQLYIQSVFSDVSMVPTIPDSIVNSASVTVTTVPGPPLNPLLVGNSLSWSPPAIGNVITGYEVQCSSTGFTTYQSYSTNSATLIATVVFTESNTEYECKVRASNNGGDGEFSSIVSAVTDPGPPTVRFSSATSDSITVTIIPNVGGGYRSSPEYTAIAVDEFANEYTSTTHTRLNPIIGGIPTATKYSVRVRTDYGGSITVPDSAPVDMYTLSESVDVDSATSTQTSVTFEWSEPFNDGSEITHYEARLDTDVEGTYTTISLSPTTINILEPNNAYTIYVYAVNPAGRSADGVTVDIVTDPYDPVLTLDGTDSYTATVSYTWDDNSGYNGYEAISYDLSITGGRIRPYTGFDAAIPTQVISLWGATSYTIGLSLLLRSSFGDITVHSNQVTALTVPRVPQIITVSMETESAFIVSWEQPAGGNVIDEYQVMATASTTVTVGNSEQSGSTSGRSITLTDLAPNTQFTITINAVNSAGIGPDGTGTGTTLPIATDPPTTKEATSDSITVMWSPPVNEAQTPQGYTVMLLNAFGLQIDSVDVSGSMLEATFTVADANTRYNAAVTSSFPNGRSLISKAGPIWSAPDQPNSVRGLSTSTDTITVAFQGVSSGYPCCDVLFYILTMYGPDGNETVEILPNGLSEFVHTFDVSPNTGYTFDVAAFNGHHTGLASPSVFIRSKPPAMEVYVDYTTSDTVGVYWNPLTTGNVDVHAYLVLVSPRFDTDPDSYIATGLSHVISGLEANRQYLVSVQAYTSGGRSPTDDSMLAFATTAPLAPPAPVQSVEYPPTATEITVDFECPQLLGCSPIGDFKLKWTQVSGNGTDGGVTGGSLTGCAGSYTITALQINTVYAIQVAVANMGNSSDYSEPVEICTNPHVPDPPTARFDLLRQGIVVDWNPPPEGGGADILEYNIAWFSTNDRGEKHVSVVGMNHTTVIRGLLPVTTYRVTVQAFNAHGAGNTSYHTEVTTGSGIVCSETPIISITAEDISMKVNPSTGDQLVISSRDVRNQHTAAELLPQCTNDLTSGDDVHFLFNITDCEPVVEYASDKFDGADNETLVYTFMIQLARQTDFSSVIQRFNPTAMFKFECIFDRTASLTADVIQPYVGKNLMVMDPEHSSFDLDFELYASDAYDTPLVGSPPRVQVLTYINAQIKLDVHSNNFVIQMQHCWATPSNSGNDTRSYPIIVNSCPAENPFDPADAIIVTRNYQPTTARFQTLAFVWSNMADEDQTMFIHCDVVVCDSDSQDGCTDWNCGTAGRKRRSVSYDRKRRLTYGPIILSNKEQDLCDEDNGGCEDTCMVENGEVACSCKEGRKLNSDRRTCSVEYYTKMLEKSVIPQPILMVVIVALVLLVLWLAFVRKPSEYQILHK